MRNRDFMLFLWLNDIDSEDLNVEIYRFARVIFGMNCSPFLLNATLKHHVSEYYAEDADLADALLAALYVDEWTSGADGESKAFELYHETNAWFAVGSFKLRKWASNSKAVINKITRDGEEREGAKETDIALKEESYAKTTVGGLDEIDPVKKHNVLELNWNLDSDMVIFKFNNISKLWKSLQPTKRSILQIAGKLFDPLGLISPVMVLLRMFLQDLCAKKYELDSISSQPSAKLFQKWLDDAEKVDHIAIRHQYFSTVTKKVSSASLHGFADASNGAYYAVVYLCAETEDGYTTSLAASKSRVAPLTPMTTPRLELIAALILVSLISTVKEALSPVINIEKIFCWTDNITVYYWMQLNRQYKQFVQNRIDEILKLTDANNWRHCAGNNNPVDVGCRGNLPSDLVNNAV